mgnify:CR=1 FL=1
MGINWGHVAKLQVVIGLLLLKRAPGTKRMMVKGGASWYDSTYIATYAEELQGMDDALLYAVRRGALDAIERYIKENQ